jgi:hypothetical protein
VTLREEAERLQRVFLGQDAQLVTYLSTQMGVVKNQAQVVLGLCGLAITVTGFSGAHMIRSGSLAAACMVVGIALILVAAVLALRTLTQVRWVSHELADDLVDTVERVLDRRNAQQRRLQIAGFFVGGGLAAYLLAVAVAALSAGSVRVG